MVFGKKVVGECASDSHGAKKYDVGGEKKQDIKMFVIDEDSMAAVPSFDSRKRHSEAALLREATLSSAAGKLLEPHVHHNTLSDFFRLNMESKVAMKLYGKHRNIDEETERQVQISTWVIHPMSNFRFYWDLVMVTMLFFQVLVLPVNIAFYSSDFSVTWLAINGISDAVFLIDIVFNFFTGIPDLDDEHLTILDRKEIQKRYLKGWFLVDLFSSMPFDYIYFLVRSTDQSHAFLKASRGFKIFKLTKLLGLLRLLRLSRLVRYMRKFEEATSITSLHLRISKLIALMLLLAHWNGCVQYLVSYLQDFPESCWVVLNGLKDATVWSKYSWGVFQAMSHMLSIGYGRYSPGNLTEAWVCILSMMIGGAFYATLIGSISTLSMGIDSSGRQYTEKVQQVTEYLNYRKLPRSLRNKVHDYYEHRYQRKCFNEEEILKEISPCLREEILMYHLGGLLRAVPFFKNADTDFLEDLVTRLKFEAYIEGSLVCKGGRTGNRMFFIQHGIVEVVTKSGDVTATLSKGAHFGEICLMSREARRVASVRTKTKCELFSLSSEDFNFVLQDYPPMREIMKKVAEARLHMVGVTDSVGNVDPQFWNKEHAHQERSSPSQVYKKQSTTFSRTKTWVHHLPGLARPEKDVDDQPSSESLRTSSL